MHFTNAGDLWVLPPAAAAVPLSCSLPCSRAIEICICDSVCVCERGREKERECACYVHYAITNLAYYGFYCLHCVVVLVVCFCSCSSYFALCLNSSLRLIFSHYYLKVNCKQLWTWPCLNWNVKCHTPFALPVHTLFHSHIQYYFSISHIATRLNGCCSPVSSFRFDLSNAR